MDPFLVNVLLSLVTGIIWVLASSYIAERVSGKLGGLLVGLPSTAVISLLFIGLTQGTPAAVVASRVMPFSSGLYCFSFIAFLLWTKKSFLTGLIGSLFVWFSFAYVSARLAPGSIAVSIAVWAIMVSVSVWWVVARISIDHEKIPKKITGSAVWVKALLTGTVISCIVLISKFAGPVWGGVFGTFPALTLSTYLITVRSGGVEFTRLIAKNVLISTTTTIGIFAVLCYLLYPAIGIWWGTVAAYAGLLAVSIPLYVFVFERIRD